MTDEQKKFEKIVHETDRAELGQMFGKPCGKIGGKAFVAFFQNEMVFKLGTDSIEALMEKYDGAENFDPSGKGRPMKDWLQVPADYAKDWKKLAAAAAKFLQTE